ncbi:PDZ/DHR/GLGF domain protein [Actinobacteria bacterium OK074]|nr:PDZ/DHR/GLGF domain protein [Actinobacteria bacterium OK074]
MEQTALRPKPMPGGAPDGDRPPGAARRPHAAPPRRGRRLLTLLSALLVGLVLVLSGVGLGTVGATVIGMSRLAELQRQAGAGGGAPGKAVPGKAAPSVSGAPGRTSSEPSPTGAKSGPVDGSSASGRAALGVEAVDAEPTGALLVGVHVPGPGYTAGLVRGDVLLSLGGTRVTSAAALARAVAAAHPGTPLTLVVRHANGTRAQLTATPGIVT